MTRSSNRRPQSGSRRAASWIYGALNPLEDALAVELELLSRGTATFRAGPDDLEYIWRVDRYLDLGGRRILEDHAAEYASLRPAIEAHDRAVDELGRAAADAHRGLVQDARFVARTRELAAAYAGADRPERLPDPVAALAEHVVNSRGDISMRYDAADFWMRHRADLMSFRTGPAFSRLGNACCALIDATQRLVEALRAERLRLCREYDIPAAQVAGVAESDAG